MRAFGAWRAAWWLLSVPAAARAEPRLEERQPDGFYASRGAAIAVAAVAAAATPLVLRPSRPAPSESEWFPLDEAERANLSVSAAKVSDAVVLVAALAPLASQLGGGLDSRFANTTVIYGEVMSAALLLNTITKYGAPRLRPYTYRREPEAVAYAQSEETDAYLSFYSGHTSGAFAAAAAGSYLFAASHPGASSSRWLWGFEAGAAGLTAVLRVRAGKHYGSDVLVGALVGSALGFGIPVLEGVRYRLTSAEAAFAAGGLAIGVATGAILPFQQNVILPLGETGVAARFAPMVGPTTAGVVMSGAF